jgi:hypothetical protein
MAGRQGLSQADGLIESGFVINGLEFSCHATSVSRFRLPESGNSPTDC